MAGAQNFVWVKYSIIHPELFQVSVMQMKQDYGVTWMWILLLQFTAWHNSDVQQQAVG
jgi:hypothetical protein